jgi:hypothetical protein
MQKQPTANSALAQCLEALGWAPTTLARKINGLFGAGTVSVSAPYYWLETGGIPRPPLPTLAAYVLSRHLGRLVTVEELWHGRASSSPLLAPADAGMDVPWSSAGTLQLLEDWLLGGLMDRRTFLAISGSTLTGLAWAYLDLEPPRLIEAGEGDSVGGTLVEQVEASVPALWALDDMHGGERVLPYVGAQLQTVALILRQGGHRGQVTRRLFGVAALLGQHAGWAAFDAGRHGLAQRYFITGLRAAHQAGDRQVGAHIVADLAYQAASRDQRHDAAGLAEAAMRAADDAEPRVLASVASRAAFAHAVAGDVDRFAECREHALEQFAVEGSAEGAPGWAYYLTPGHVDALSGSGLVSLARTAFDRGQARKARAYLADGVRLLGGNAALRGLDHPHQRLAAVEGAWLALAHTLHSELEQACKIGRLTLDRLPTVRSARCLDVLAALRAELRSGRMNNAEVREFVPSLDRALHAHVA